LHSPDRSVEWLKQELLGGRDYREGVEEFQNWRPWEGQEQ
jgi:hypothetical protein